MKDRSGSKACSWAEINFYLEQLFCFRCTLLTGSCSADSNLFFGLSELLLDLVLTWTLQHSAFGLDQANHRKLC